MRLGKGYETQLSGPETPTRGPSGDSSCTDPASRTRPPPAGPCGSPPYIWVHRSADTTLEHEHEHEHEDPRLGVDNHVYVKIHNDGTASESGELELYFTAASANLNDPTSWTPIDTRSETLSPGVAVFDFLWSDLPGEGHYCLLARWDTDGSALAFTDIGAAVRNDNDLIWRNVNIVDLSGDIEDSAGDFMMAGHRRFRETYLVLESDPKNPPGLDWPALVRVTMALDTEVLAVNPQMVQNLEPLSGGRYRVPVAGKGARAVIGPFRMGPRQQALIALDFEPDRNAVRKARAGLVNPCIRHHRQPGGRRLANAAAARGGVTVLGGVTFTLMVPPAGLRQRRPGAGAWPPSPASGSKPGIRASRAAGSNAHDINVTKCCAAASNLLLCTAPKARVSRDTPH